MLHKNACPVENHAHDGSHSQDYYDAPDSAEDNLPKGLLDLPGGVEHFFDDGGYCEAKGQGDADQSHAPIDVADGFVGKEDVDQIVGGSVVFDLDQAGKNLEHLIEESHNPAQDSLDVIEKTKNRGIEDTLDERTHRVSHPARYFVPKISDQDFLPPFLSRSAAVYAL